MTRIRLADWRDWRPVHALRRELAPTLDGGLYELLTWPIYHAHCALIDDQIVGVSGVVLWPDGKADDVGTVVRPSSRRQRVASELRAAQARDLLRMGWRALYCAVDAASAVAVACATAHFGPALGDLPDGTRYFGTPLATLAARLAERGVRPPYPLSPANDAKLTRKADAARADLVTLQTRGEVALTKAALRV